MSSRKGGESVLTTMRMTGSDSYVASALRGGKGINEIMDGLRRHYPSAAEADLNSAWSCGLRAFAAGSAQQHIDDDSTVDPAIVPPPERQHNGYGYYCIVRYLSGDKPQSGLAGLSIYSLDLLTGRQLTDAVVMTFNAIIQHPDIPCVVSVPKPPVVVHSYTCYCICPEMVTVP